MQWLQEGPGEEKQNTVLLWMRLTSVFSKIQRTSQISRSFAPHCCTDFSARCLKPAGRSLRHVPKAILVTFLRKEGYEKEKKKEKKKKKKRGGGWGRKKRTREEHKENRGFEGYKRAKSKLAETVFCSGSFMSCVCSVEEWSKRHPVHSTQPHTLLSVCHPDVSPLMHNWTWSESKQTRYRKPPDIKVYSILKSTARWKNCFIKFLSGNKRNKPKRRK